MVSGSGVSFADANNANTQVTLTAGDATIQAVFALKTYTISVQSTAGGTTSSSGTATHGVPFAITATPNSGYGFVKWAVTSGTATVSDIYDQSTTITLTNGNASVAAYFSNIMYISSSGNDSYSGLETGRPKQSIITGITRAQDLSITDVRVSEGTYTVSSAITLYDGLSLKGGYSSDYSSRDTILSANTTTINSTSTGTATLTGTNVSSALVEGFRLYGSNSVSHRVITLSSSSPIIRYCMIIARPSVGSGSKMAVSIAGTNTARVEGCIVMGGGNGTESRGFYITGGNAAIVNNFIHGGTAQYAKGIEVWNSSPNIYNNTVYANGTSQTWIIQLMDGSTGHYRNNILFSIPTETGRCLNEYPDRNGIPTLSETTICSEQQPFTGMISLIHQ